MLSRGGDIGYNEATRTTLRISDLDISFIAFLIASSSYTRSRTRSHPLSNLVETGTNDVLTSIGEEESHDQAI